MTQAPPVNARGVPLGLAEHADPRADAAAAADIGWRLTELVDVASLQRIQDTFARTFGLPTAILNPDGTYATAMTNRSPFCEDVMRGSAVAGPLCADCDLYAKRSAHAHAGRVSIFECWHGLYDAAVPITVRDRLLGYFLCGQVLESPHDRDARAARAVGVEPNVYLRALAEVPVVPFGRYEAAVEGMHVLAGLIGEQALSAIESMRMVEEATRARADARRLVDQLDGILGALRDINAQPDYEATLHAIVERLGRLVPSDACTIWVLDPDAEELVPAFVRDPMPEQLQAHRPGLHDSLLGEVARSGRPLVSDDVTREPGFAPIAGVPVEAEAAVMAPLVHKERVLGVLSLSRFGARTFGEHEVRLLTVLSSEAAVAMAVAQLDAERARLHARERELAAGYRRLSELSTELAGARDVEQARAALVARAAQVVGADVCMLALVGDGPDGLELDVGNARGHGRRAVELRGAARVATLRLRDEDAPSRSLFDTFAEGVLERLGDEDRPVSFHAEPVTAGGRVLGALLLGWERQPPPESEQRTRMVEMLAGTAGSNLARLTAATATDEALRARHGELEALGQLAQRMTGMTDEHAIAAELLHAFRRAGDFDAALYAVAGEDGARAALDGATDPDWAAALRAVARAPGEAVALPGGRAMHAEPVLAPGRVEAVLVGVAATAPTPPRRRVMATLARYGSIAFENAHLHDTQREAIASLRELNVSAEQHKARLERILAIHDALTATAIGGGGLVAIVASLGELLDGELLVADARGEQLAHWPPGADLAWARDVTLSRGPQTLASALPDGTTLLAAPAVAGGDVLAWLLSRTPEQGGEPLDAAGEPTRSAPDARRATREVERATVEYGALLVGLELLRERTAVDVEMRLRGGFLEDLLGDAHAPELLVREARAFELDLSRPFRVVLAAHDPAADDAAGAARAATGAATAATRAAVGGLRSLYELVGGCARGWGGDAFVAVKGDTVVALVEEREDDGEACFEDALRARLDEHGERTVMIAVGTPTAAVADFRRSHRAALRGLDLLRLHLLGEDQRLFSFRIGSVETLLFEINEPQAVLDFVARWVRPLDEYDCEHTSELRRTLQEYFLCGGRLAECARRLHIHVATLRYRLGKASQLLCVDLRDPRVALDLQLALRAAQLLDAHDS